MVNYPEKVERFAILISKEVQETNRKEYPDISDENILPWSTVTIKHGEKYIKIDVGTSGKYMIDAEGNIFGIKGYGIINKKKPYGTLDTIHEWYWGKYYAEKLDTYLATDQPQVCGKCGTRTDIIYEYKNKQKHSCKKCGYVFILEV